MVTKNKRLPSYEMSIATRNDLLEASKAIHDQLNTTLDSRMKEIAEVRLARLEERMNALEGMIHDGLAGVAEILKNLPVPVVEVNLPEMNPVVAVNVPEQPAPTVTVDVHPAKPMRKEIEYDEYGRPHTITEKENK